MNRSDAWYVSRLQAIAPISQSIKPVALELALIDLAVLT